ncbi:MAG TPA: helix-turn-helix domain-containing protein, partial [Chitinophagaceae bacterium]|nr:helix-turn-helix domain-containing protein [Chitinophagaceae bacterium]
PYFTSVQHVEFFHKDHFQHRYHRVPPPASLAHFIDFFWETDFDNLWTSHPNGFSDALFPNIGYTYLINLGTPFVMQLADKNFEMKGDGFLPRHTSIECYHRPGNKLFGIKFRISPVIFEKKVDFSEYREYIFPLSYLIDRKIVERVKKAASFDKRVNILSTHYQHIVEKYAGSLQPVHIVREILDHCFQQNDFTTPIEIFAQRYNISTRTLQRYFETTTGISSKKALQIMRIRKAVAHLASSPQSFHYSQYGYYDHSHFVKHLKSFVNKSTLHHLQPHLKLLQALHKSQ